MFDTDHVREGIPSGLDEMDPGPVLAAFLSAIDVEAVSGHNRIIVLKAQRKMAAHYATAGYRSMAAVTDAMGDEIEDPLWATEAAAAEIRAALRLTRRSADDQVALALDLRRRLPRVLESLLSGVIDERRARVLVNGTCHLPEGTARSVVDEVLDDAARLTTGQLAARLRRSCIDTDPDSAVERYRQAVEQRRVVAEPTDDGTSHLMGFELPPDRVQRVTDRINRLARRLRSGDETRTMDQLRADVFLDLLSGTEPGTQGRADVRVDLETLARLADHAGDLAGYGPVVGEIARKVAEGAGDCSWRFTVTHPASGAVVESGALRRRPTAAQRRRIEARNDTCVFPGCRMPATGCDLDHRVPHAEGGPTTDDNLDPLCAHDHQTNKHRIGWRCRRLPDGDYLWMSPLGHLYTTSGRPPP